MTAPTLTATSVSSLAVRPSFDWDPSARCPDWVVLGRIRERLAAGQPVPPQLCPRDEVRAYVPALVAAGHTASEISRATGVNARRSLSASSDSRSWRTR